MKNKTCTKCGRELPLSAFGKHRYSKDGHAWRCLECSRKQAKQYRETPNGIYKNMKAPNLFWGRHKFEITKEEFIEWYNSQERTCVYCGLLEENLGRCGDSINQTTKRLSIDCINNDMGYVKGNLVLSCLRCNNIKNDIFTFEQMCEIGQKYISPIWDTYINNNLQADPKGEEVEG